MVVELSFIKQGVVVARFEPVSYDICILKAKIFYMDKHLITINLKN